MAVESCLFLGLMFVYCFIVMFDYVFAGTLSGTAVLVLFDVVLWWLLRP